MPYDVYPYSTTSPSYFPTLSVSQTNHDSTAKSIDRIPGQKRSEQSKDSEQESSPNVNMVSGELFMSSDLSYDIAEKKGTESCLSASV